MTELATLILALACAIGCPLYMGWSIGRAETAASKYDARGRGSL